MQPVDRLTGKEDRKNRIRTKKEPTKLLERNYPGCSPKYELKTPRLHYGAATERPETIKLPAIPEVVWPPPQESHLFDVQKISATKINNSTHTPELKRKNDVAAQTSSIKETSLNYSDLVRNRTWETKLEAPQYNPSMSPRNNNMKSKEMSLTWQPVTVKWQHFPSQNNNFTNWRAIFEGRYYQWTLYATLLQKDGCQSHQHNGITSYNQ